MIAIAGLLLAVSNVSAPSADTLAVSIDTLAAVRALADSTTLPGLTRVVTRSVIATGGTGTGAVLDPTGVAVDPFGRVYVTDAALHRMQCFEADGRPVDSFGALGSDPEQLQRPSGVATLGALGIAVLDRDNRRVQTFDLFGRRLGVLIDLGADDLQRQIGSVDAMAIASDRGGALALLDHDRDRVLVFDFSGKPVRVMDALGSALGSFRGVRGLAFTPRGELVTAERGNARIQIFDAGGRVARSWAVPVGPGSGALALSVDGDGRVALADETTGGLWLWAPDGTPIGSWRGLGHPRGLAFAPDATLLVAESSPPRVRRLAIQGPAAVPKER
jgi:DNA-binding beta-propeller fold protein YncE